MAVAIPLAFIALVSLAVICAGILAPYDPLAQNLPSALSGPSAQHLLGTDSLGRDILSRLLYGGQPALLGVAIALIVFVVCGVALGSVAGYLGGWVDKCVGIIVDMFMALPNMIIILAVLAVFSQSQTAAMVTLGVLASGNLIRIVRGSVLTLKEELYVSAAVVSGLGDMRIIARHILPGVVGPVLVQLSIFSGVALSVQTGLGFLGVASKPPAPSWGSMVGEAAEVMSAHGFFLAVTGGVIALLTFAFGFLGDGLRDLSSESKKQPAAPLYPKRPIDRRSNVSLPSSDQGARLAVHDYSVGFRTDGGIEPTVKQLNWSIQAGEILGLVGESGSGKTVTALSLLGLLPANGEVTSGCAFLDGREISSLTESEYEEIRGSEIGLVSQEPMVALDPAFTISSQLTEVLRLHHRGTRRDLNGRALELLRQVQLPDPGRLLRKYPHELSGGMIQRVVIAIALAGSPKLLIADEPTTALDVTVQAEILDLLRDLRDQTGMSIILVTHDLGVVADLCDRILIMSQGEVVEQGLPDDIFYRPAQEYTQKLIAATPSLAKELQS
ncbi:ATP-binding cassette domain-containing protein [Arthrobacter sp.]|uniref:ATP-binding cassette domain-containing protein n=1 Tax=Arthrobacter sp. TaxID=1667 RepID=UPI003A90446F